MNKLEHSYNNGDAGAGDFASARSGGGDSVTCVEISPHSRCGDGDPITSIGNDFATSATYATLFPMTEHSDDLVSTYMNRFINTTCFWGKQYLSKGKMGYAWQKPDMKTYGGRFKYEPVTRELVLRVFAGEISCAWAGIDEQRCSRWLAFDSDEDDGSLDQLETALRSWGLHLIREGRRPGRAGHIWILFDKPVPVKLLITLSNAMLKLAGVELKSPKNPNGIERFPGSDKGLTQVRAPFSINLKPEAAGVRGWFDNVEHDIMKQLQWLATQPLNSAAAAIREAEIHRPQTAQKRTNRKGKAPRTYNRINILDHLSYRQIGNSFVAQCPLCALEGHDLTRDNLKITLDGTKFCCVFGGPSSIHKNAEIVNQLKGGSS